MTAKWLFSHHCIRCWEYCDIKYCGWVSIDICSLKGLEKLQWPGSGSQGRKRGFKVTWGILL